MMKALGLALLLGVSFLCGPLEVRAEGDRPMIEVTPGKMRAFKAAVQQFAEPRVPVPEGQPLPEERAPRFRKELERGLVFSRTVVPLPREAFLAPQITRNLTDRRRYDCGDWARMGTDVLVEGELRDRGTEVEVTFQVWDPTRCLRLMQRSFRVPASRLPHAARHVADLIVGVLTGSRGSSETEVAFISTRNGPSEVFVMDADGNRIRAATKSDARKSFPGWLPRAEAIVYTGFAAGGLPGLYLTSRGKVRPGPLLPQILEGLPKYRGVVSPTGDAIAIVTSVGGGVGNLSGEFGWQEAATSDRQCIHRGEPHLVARWRASGLRLRSIGLPSDLRGGSQGRNSSTHHVPGWLQYVAGLVPRWSLDRV